MNRPDRRHTPLVEAALISAHERDMVKNSWLKIFLVVGGGVWIVGLAERVTRNLGERHESPRDAGEQALSGTEHPAARAWIAWRNAPNEGTSTVPVAWLRAPIVQDAAEQGWQGQPVYVLCGISGSEIRGFVEGAGNSHRTPQSGTPSSLDSATCLTNADLSDWL